MQQTVTLRKWGNSTAVRIPHEVLDSVGVTADDKLNVNIENGMIVLKPEKKNGFEKLFEGYDTSQPYPFEFVDKGGAIGRELN